VSVSSVVRPAEGDSATPAPTLQSALRPIVAYVQSEAVASYIVVLGLLNPAPEATHKTSRSYGV
jgi:hypothetical protein